jgi:hypothetical protein
MLLTAPAGRGKSALLVRWLEQLKSDQIRCLTGDWPVAFVPISIRFETNRPAVFYQALAVRLAQILGEPIQTTANDPEPFYREAVAGYVRRFNSPAHRCLLVIDGLDEASGAESWANWLPGNPPDGLRVVASARELAGDTGAREWLERLGWSRPRGRARSITLTLLDREGIADVLVKMGFPLATLAQDVDIIGELYRLTEYGDPLLLTLYVEDLLSTDAEAPARVRPQDLRTLEPGFRQYFTRWLREQKDAWKVGGESVDETVVEGLLAVLAVALGPLNLGALAGLLPRVLGRAALISADTVRPLRRFIKARRAPTPQPFR